MSDNPWEQYLKDCQLAINYGSTWHTQGRLTRVSGLVLEAKGLQVPVGSVCQIETTTGYKVEAEVVGFAEDFVYLMPSTQVVGLEPGALVFLADPDAGRIPKPRMRYSTPPFRRSCAAGRRGRDTFRPDSRCNRAPLR